MNGNVNYMTNIWFCSRSKLKCPIVSLKIKIKSDVIPKKIRESYEDIVFSVFNHEFNEALRINKVRVGWNEKCFSKCRSYVTAT